MLACSSSCVLQACKQRSFAWIVVSLTTDFVTKTRRDHPVLCPFVTTCQYSNRRLSTIMTQSTDNPTTIVDTQTKSDNKSDADKQQLDDLIHQVEGLKVKEPEEEENVSPEIRRAAKWISEAKRILVLSGAGVSCSAGESASSKTLQSRKCLPT